MIICPFEDIRFVSYGLNCLSYVSLFIPKKMRLKEVGRIAKANVC